MAPSPRARSSAFAVILVALSASAASSARAELPSIDARTWRPSTDPNASLVLEPAITPGAGVVSVGAYGSYAYRPLTLPGPTSPGMTTTRPIEHAVGFDAVANVGIGSRFALGLLVPVAVYQTGTSGLPKTASDVSKVPAAALGDLGLSLKGSLLRNDNGGFGLAALGYLSVPTGNGHAFAGEGGPTATARLLAEYTLLIATVQASAGYKLRTRRETWPAQGSGGVTFGDELPWSVGFGLRPGVLGLDPGNRQRWELAAHGALPVGPSGPFGLGAPGSAELSPALLAVSDRFELGHYRDAFVVAGADIGLNRAIGVPALRVMASIGFAPRAHDLDHDGVLDDVDGCPEIPEDLDGFEDSDGCPEVDNDDDGVLDRDDACVNKPGVESTDPKKNGCPIQDADGDGIEDAKDRCVELRGIASSDPTRNGCPLRDTDGDGIEDRADKCPSRAEDRDGFEDEDGCPEVDNDGDRIADADDACPNEAGEPSSDPTRNGCPKRDRDGDTFDNDVDACPDAPESWNGVSDEDGCPDEGGKALVTVDAKRVVHVALPIHIVGIADAEVAPTSVPTLRALGALLNAHPEWSLAVGAKPAKGDPTQVQLDALMRSFAVVRELAQFAHRDGAAETVSWDVVKKNATAGSDVAFLILVSPELTAPKPIQVKPDAPSGKPIPPPFNPSRGRPLTAPSPL